LIEKFAVGRIVRRPIHLLALFISQTTQFHFTHSITPVYNANTAFYFKCHLQSRLKFVKKSLKSHFLFISCNMFRPHRAIIRQPLIDRNHCTAWVHSSIYLHSIIVKSSYSRMCTRTFLVLFPCCGVHIIYEC
jgi:hypothetical protein